MSSLLYNNSYYIMKILSIDVGIKNLAFCLMESDHENQIKIHKWDVVNLCNNDYFCKVCQKKAKFCKNDDYYCKSHAKTSDYQIPTIEININKIKKLKINELYALAISFNIEYSKPILKQTLLDKFRELIKDKYLEHIIERRADCIDLIELGINMRNNFDTILDLEMIDKIIIENKYNSNSHEKSTGYDCAIFYYER